MAVVPELPEVDDPEVDPLEAADEDDEESSAAIRAAIIGWVALLLLVASVLPASPVPSAEAGTAWA